MAELTEPPLEFAPVKEGRAFEGEYDPYNTSLKLPSAPKVFLPLLNVFVVFLYDDLVSGTESLSTYSS